MSDRETKTADAEHLAEQGTVNCRHVGEPSWWEHDGYGIPLTRVCADCERVKMSKFRPDIKSRYETEDVVEPEDGCGPGFDWEDDDDEFRYGRDY